MSDQTLSSPPEGAEFLGDVLDLADQLVEQITDAQVEDRLRRLLDGQHRSQQFPSTAAPTLYLVSSGQPGSTQDPDDDETAAPQSQPGAEHDLEPGQLSALAADRPGQPVIRPDAGWRHRLRGPIAAAAAVVIAAAGAATAYEAGGHRTAPPAPWAGKSQHPVTGRVHSQPVSAVVASLDIPFPPVPPNSSFSSVPPFPPDSAALTAADDKTLASLVGPARSQHLRLTITGYASPDGSAAYDLALSRMRADAVSHELIALGLPAHDITTVMSAGSGGTILGDCQGTDAKARCSSTNRVTITLTRPATGSEQQEGHPARTATPSTAPWWWLPRNLVLGIDPGPASP
jgi:outer membrane protein OmpA-like peptidoglycan-associated protein